MSTQLNNQHAAALGNTNGYTEFTFNGTRIRFLAPHSLEYYDRVKTWDKGYLVVDAKYSHNPTLEEEYIDLVPILEDLYIDPVSFLEPINTVEVARHA